MAMGVFWASLELAVRPWFYACRVTLQCWLWVLDNLGIFGSNGINVMDPYY